MLSPGYRCSQMKNLLLQLAVFNQGLMQPCQTISVLLPLQMPSPRICCVHWWNEVDGIAIICRNNCLQRACLGGELDWPHDCRLSGSQIGFWLLDIEAMYAKWKNSLKYQKTSPCTPDAFSIMHAVKLDLIVFKRTKICLSKMYFGSVLRIYTGP